MSKASTSRFAGSFGLAPKATAGARADDGDKKETDEEKKSRRAKDRAKKEGESDDDYAKRCAELDDKEKAEDEKEKNDASAPAAQPSGAEEPKDDEKSAKARADGALAERKRWEVTLSDPRCSNKGLTACNLLATSSLSSDAILAVLDTVPESVTAAEAPKQPGLAARMAQETIIPPTPSAPAPSGASAMAAEINKAAEMARTGKF